MVDHGEGVADLVLTIANRTAYSLRGGTRHVEHSHWNTSWRIAIIVRIVVRIDCRCRCCNVCANNPPQQQARRRQQTHAPSPHHRAYMDRSIVTM